MNKRLFISLIIILITLFSLRNVHIILAQQNSPQDATIPSDLALDLTLAQQNPSPDRQEILHSETKQTQIVTNTGATTTLTPQDILAPEVKTESPKDTIHPEQTTSEQVISVPTTIEVDKNGTPIPTNGENQPATNSESPDGNSSQINTNNNLVPGTNVVEPNDNVAPADNSTNPNLPTPTSNENNTNGTPVEQPTINDQQNTNTIPLENGTSNENNSQSGSSDSSSNNSSNNSTDNTSNNSNTGSVQGASTGPTISWWQKILNTISHIVRK